MGMWCLGDAARGLKRRKPQDASRIHGSVLVIAAAGLASGLGSVAHAKDDPKKVKASEPAANVPADALSGSRLVRVFDFEEPDNPDPVPASWFRAQDAPPDRRRIGFPAFNQAEFDHDVARSGTTSVRLPTRGGSVALRLAPGEIPIFSDADYRVSAQIRTSNLEHARAFIVARLLDQQLKPIEGAEARSEAVKSVGVWTNASLVIEGSRLMGRAGPQAAWLQIDLELLQPKQVPGAEASANAYTIWREDVEGAAWFDDVSVGLVPRTTFASTTPTSVFVAPEAPAVRAQVRDLGGRELTGVVRVLDMRGREVDRASAVLDPSGRGWTVTPRLGGYGWYRAILEVRAAEEAVSKREAWFLSLPPVASRTAAGSAQSEGEKRRFGIAADGLPEEALGALPELLDHLGTKMIILPAVDPGSTADDAKARLEKRGPLLEALMKRGQEITLAFTRVPDGMEKSLSLEADDVLGMFEHSDTAAPWAKVIEPTLDVYGQRILRYQIGATGDHRFSGRAPEPGAKALEHELAKMVPGPEIALARSADEAAPEVAKTGTSEQKGGALIDAVTVVYPAGFALSGIRETVQRFGAGGGEGTSGREVTFVPQLPASDRFGFEARVIEAGRRIAEFWAVAASGDAPTAPARIALGGVDNSCWRLVDPDGDGGYEQSHAPMSIEPGPELGVLACMADRLAGRRVISQLPTEDGVKAYLLATPLGNDRFANTGIVAWNESASPEKAKVEVISGEAGAVRVFDVFGNLLMSPSASVNGGAAGGAGVSMYVGLAEAPVFIEGVDPYLSLLTSTFRIEPSFVPAIVAEHEHTIQLKNPWPIRISGKLQLKQSDEPDGSRRSSGADWQITPNVMEFALGPGETASLPVTLSFGAGQLGGKKDFVIVARVQADKAYPAVRLRETLEVGLPDLTLEPEAQLGPGPSGPDVQVIASVTNKDSKPRTLRLEATAKGQSSQQLQISDLPPGQTAIKRFIFKNAAKDLSGLRVLVTLSDSEGAARLNKAVMVP
jgi:hypothetical protein